MVRSAAACCIRSDIRVNISHEPTKKVTMMSKLKKMIEQETHRIFQEEALVTAGTGQKRQISIRPDEITLTKIDTLAGILDMSRQGLLDDIMEQGIEDAIDAYCEAHGPQHSEEAREGFRQAFMKRWEEMNKGADQ